MTRTVFRAIALVLALCATPLPLSVPDAFAAGKTVTINGDVDDNVYGNGNNPDGTATDPNALDKLLDPNNNTVTINSGTVGGYVVGGHAEPLSGSATASGNSVTINSGGEVDSNVMGGFASTSNGCQR